MLESGTNCRFGLGIWASADRRCCKTSDLVTRPARTLICRASSPNSANNRAATGVGFSAGNTSACDEPAAGETPAASDDAAAGDGPAPGEEAAAGELAAVGHAPAAGEIPAT